MLGRDDIREVSHRGAVGNVEAVSGHANTVIAHQLRRASQPSLVDVGQREVATAARQRNGDRPPDAACGARDHSRSSFESHAFSHGSPLPLSRRARPALT